MPILWILFHSAYWERMVCSADSVQQSYWLHIVVRLCAHADVLPYVLTDYIVKLMSFADTIVALEDGAIAQTGSPEVLLANEGYVSQLGLALRDEHTRNTRVSQVETTSIEASTSTPTTPDDIDEILDTRRKSGDWSVYRYYFSSSGHWVLAMFLITMALWIFCTEFSSTCIKLNPNATSS
jgi:ATP-binding cassette subfamily C (CFTR/MRP) protein 1